MTARRRGEEGVRVRALGVPLAGRETEACLPVSSTGVETEKAATEVMRRRTEGMSRGRLRCGGAMAAAALGILDGGRREMEKGRYRQVALKRRGVRVSVASGRVSRCSTRRGGAGATLVAKENAFFFLLYLSQGRRGPPNQSASLQKTEKSKAI